MISVRLAFAALSLASLSACADPPSQTGTAATQATPDPVVSLCYSGQTTTRAELAQMALEYCPAGTVRVDVWDHDTFWNDCPISKKNRVTYRCVVQ